MKIIVDGANAVSSFVNASKIRAQNFADVDVIHDAGKKCRRSAGFITSGIWLEKLSNATETFGANSGAVSVRKVVGLLLVCLAEDASSVPLDL